MSPNTPNPRHRALASESGSIIILTALSMVVLLGILAFAVDASFLYTERNRMAAAADGAAKAGALEAQRGVTNLQPFVYREVTLHGFDPGGSTSVQWHRPPVSGAFSGNSHYVEVLVSQPTNTFFARGANAAFGTVTPVARAVAGISTPEFCLITLQDVSIGNHDVFNMNGCDVSVGRDLDMGNSSDITGNPIPNVLVGNTCSGPCGSNVLTGQVVSSDPFAGLPTPVVAGGCSPAASNPLPPGCYSTIAADTTLLPGIFKVTGAITAKNLTGNGVLLYLTSSASYDPPNNSTLTLTAQSSGTYAGVAMYGDFPTGPTMVVNNSLQMTITGAVYMRGTDADFKNNLSIVNTGCSLFMFKSFTEKNGTGAFDTGTCASAFGSASYLGISLAE